MRVEILAYLIFSEVPEHPENVMHVFYLEYSGTPPPL